MSLKVVFVERRDPETLSIERVFSVVGRQLSRLDLKVERKKLPFGNSITGMIANIFAKRPPAADVYHVTGQAHYYALLLPRDKTVLTIHDLQVLKNRRGLRKYLLKQLFYVLPVRKLKYITVVSERVKEELVRATFCDERSVIVIDNPMTIVPAEHMRPFHQECPTILHIGTAAHKNLPNLILALEGIRCRLRIIGRLESAMVRMLNERSIEFENRFDLSDKEILDEYQNADIVSFCTVAEGFGLPIIEAQALSIPLITSDLAPMNDIAGEGAILVDPHNPATIRKGISRIINDTTSREDMVRKGRENIKRFEPEKVAADYRDLYQRIVSDSQNNLGK